MKQTILATLRRAREPVFVQRYFVGRGIDIAGSGDRLHAHTYLFPRLDTLLWWDSSRGGLSGMEGLDDASLDFVHANLCLANEANPAQTLARWLDLLKPGGFAIVTVPDEDLYEKGAWPSRIDEKHQSSFTIFKPVKALPNSVNVLELVRSLAHVAECERLNLIVDQFDPARADEDQTAHGIAECAIEFVLRKRAVPSAHERMVAMLQARSADDALRACIEGVQAYPYRQDVCHHAHLALLHWRLESEVDGIIAQSAALLPNERYPQLIHALHSISRGKLQEGFRLREAVVAPSG